MSISGTPVAQFTVWDYVVFVVMLLISISIGGYQAVKARGQLSNTQFLLGGRQMTAVPVAMSLTASFMSAITVIGTPAEVYRYGAMFLLFCISYAIVSIVSAEIFLPVFYRLNITSTYEGGLKAVIWTDVFQMGIMISGFLAVIIRGVVVQGSFERIWNISYHGGRLNFWDFDPDPLRRHTFWTIVVGGSFTWTAIYGINQSQVQRYISCKNQCEAKLSLYFNMIGLWIIAICAVFSGLTMYSIYYQCDPLTAKQVRAPDQLLPYLVMDILRDYPGIPGLFVAAAYSGTLSTASSSINALAAVTVEDFITPHITFSDQKLSWITKGLSLMYGLICIAMAGLSSVMGSVLQAALTIFGICGGPLLGFFLLGMIFPCANSIGAISGLAISFILTLWVGISGHVYTPLPDHTRPLHLSIAGCLFNITEPLDPVTGSPWTTINPVTELNSRPAIADTWYSISYLYLSAFATMVVLILGLIISLLTGGRKNNVDKKLLITPRDLVCCFCFADTSEITPRYSTRPRTVQTVLSTFTGEGHQGEVG
uniref:sodium-coupled monocarboxylate transporter 1-like isoform X5 n=1 Tax=Pristiophorus japonicus TaxID=55135 RepID=UPI00398E87B4